ncbi:MAG TPA: hypothetical protein VM051_05935 [Usitatibacter sp.]|nr:hypothetical protein [Usitatibacter sp.]
MKNFTCIATLAFAALAAACAAPQASVGSSAAAAPARSASYYCSRERLTADGERLECNWQPTADDACRFANTSVMQRGTLASDPQPAGRCNTGQWLVKVSPR